MNCERCEAELQPPRRKWCSEACRKRAAEQHARDSCPRCGKSMGVGTTWASRGAKVCRTCRYEQERQAHEDKLDDIQQMWEEGLSIKEIAAAIGRRPYNGAVGPEMAELRRRGRISYRYEALNRQARERAAEHVDDLRAVPPVAR